MRFVLWAVIFVFSSCTDKKGNLDEMECLKLNVPESCQTWAKKLEAFDMTKAMEVYAKVCHAKHASGCIRLGDLLATKSPSEAQTWFRRGCQLGSDRACLKQSELMLKRAK